MSKPAWATRILAKKLGVPEPQEDAPNAEIDGGRKNRKNRKNQPKMKKNSPKLKEDDDFSEDEEVPRGAFAKLNWKKVAIDDAMRGEAGLVALEELDPADYPGLYSLSGMSTPVAPSTTKKKEKKPKKTNKRKRENPPTPAQSEAVSADGEVQKRKTKRRKKSAKQTPAATDSATEATTGEESADGAEPEGAATHSDSAKPQKKGNQQEPRYVPAIVPTANVEDWKRKFGRLKSWAQFNLHPKLLQAIKEYKFFSPTPIQEKSLIAALKEGKDVVGVAETGSGKTLAYGLPILHNLTKKREKEERDGLEEEMRDRRLKALILAPTRELAVQVSDQLKLIAKHTPIKVVPVIGGLAPQKQIRLLSRKPEIVVATPGRLWELINEGDKFLGDFTGLEFLVIDEADRMVETGHFAELKSILVLVQHPVNRELIVLPSTPSLRHVLPPTEEELSNNVPPKEDDEGEVDDENGDHEAEGEDDDNGEETELKEENEDDQQEEINNQDEVKEEDENEEEEEEEDIAEEEEEIKPEPPTEEAPQKEFKRQTFVFSATLTIAPQGRAKLGPKAKNYKTGMNALSQVSKLVGFERTRKVIDLTTKKVVVSTLEEAVIQCVNEEKDYYLYYFTQQHKGRTLVFCNSISCIRRLVPILNHLKVTAYPLHANMQQRQRLKNLERFRTFKECVLIATDVAARGLDIPLVDHVIHYQLPRTAELYVHRSGRTARAAASGLSVMLVGPEDMKTYRQICSVLRSGREVEPFPVDRGLLPGVAKRVNLGRKLDVLVHEVRKKKSQKEWFKQAAEEMDIDIDEDILSSEDEDTVMEDRKKQKEIEGLKQQLATLLSQPLLHKGGFTTFFTRSLFYDPNMLSEKVLTAASEAAGQKKKAKSRRKGRK